MSEVTNMPGTGAELRASEIVARNIRALVRWQGWTQAQFGQRVGIGRGSIGACRMTCGCSGCAECSVDRGDCWRLVTPDVDWCVPCRDEYQRQLRSVMAEFMDERERAEGAR